MTKSFVLVALLVTALAASSGAIDQNPQHTLLWNRFNAVRQVDGFAVALAKDGVVVCEYDSQSGEYVHVNQVFTGVEPLEMKIFDSILVVKDVDEHMLFFDLQALPNLIFISEFDPGIPLSDFVLAGDDLFLSGWFEGVWRYTSDGLSDFAFVDSSMKPILSTRLQLVHDTLYVLDEYNGIFRFSLDDDGLEGLGYLFVPERALSFCKVDALYFISTYSDSILIGEFGHAGSGIVASLDGDIRAAQKTLVTDTRFIFVSDRSVSVVRRYNLSLTAEIVIGNDLVDGDLVTIDDVDYLLLPDFESGLNLYRLDGLLGPIPAFHRPGPVSSLLLHDGNLFTGGGGNPIDVYEISPEEGPELSYTMYEGLQNVGAFDRNGDSLIVLYTSLNKLAFITNGFSADSFYLESSIFVDTMNADDIEFVEQWPDSLSGVLVRGRLKLGVYTINDSAVVEYTTNWPFIAEVNGVCMADSLLFVSIAKRLIMVYTITPDYDLVYHSEIDLSAPVHEMLMIGDRLVYFVYDLMYYVDVSDIDRPSTDTVVTLPVPVTDAVFQGRYMYTVGEKGIGIYDVSGLYPVALDYGGREGSFLAVDSNIIVTSTGESVHMYVVDDLIFTDVEDPAEAPLPQEYGLSQNYPNPFNPYTVIEFALPTAGVVRLEVFNLLGQRVSTLLDRRLSAGKHSVYWDATGSDGARVASGVYFYRLSAGDMVVSKKMMLLK